MISKKQPLICQECRKEFFIFPSALKVGKGKFCSKKCYLLNQSKLQEKEFKWVVDSKTGCWNCVSHTIKKDGKSIYPRPKIKRNGKNYMIHQYSFLIHKGYIPKLIMHTCDNLTCVNPDHLKVGTPKENSQDMVNKNRQAKGEKNGGGVKLNSQKVVEIKQKLIEGRSLMSLAKEYNVSKKTIVNIKKGRKWKHINIP
jgi:hypothetical protein